MTVSTLFVYSASNTVGRTSPGGVPARTRRSIRTVSDSPGWTSVKDQFSCWSPSGTARTDELEFTMSKWESFVKTSQRLWATKPPTFRIVRRYVLVSPASASPEGEGRVSTVWDGPKLGTAEVAFDRKLPFRPRWSAGTFRV